jgi:hypothetical protein
MEEREQDEVQAPEETVEDLEPAEGESDIVKGGGQVGVLKAGIRSANIDGP